MIRGSSDVTYSPNGNLTIAETITLAVRIHCIYTTGAEPEGTAQQGKPWYDPYIAYAQGIGIIGGQYNDYNAPAARSEVAVIFAKALPDGALGQIRTVPDGSIPDVSVSASYAPSVYALYRAGILNGNDDNGTFAPATTIKRSEIAVICSRLADPSIRVATTFGGGASGGEKPALTAREISEKCSPAVFYIECYAYNGRRSGSGSGFFISSDGLAITNFHVAANTSRMVIMTTDGSTYNANVILDSDSKNDIALIEVEGSGFPYLEMGDSGALRQGDQVYAIGSPRGYDNSMSQGIVSNAKRELDGIPFIQISASMTYGSSGGALLNDRGEAIGITSAIIPADGAQLNLAVPINLAKALNRNKNQPIEDNFDYKCYQGFTQAVDFGAFSFVTIKDYVQTPLGHIFDYDAFDFVNADYFAHTMLYYQKALVGQGFEYKKIDENTDAYKSDKELVVIRLDLYDTKSISVSVSRLVQYYKNHPKLPDLSWYSGLPLTEGPTIINSSTLYGYEWTGYYTERGLAGVIVGYCLVLELEGFVFRGGENGNYLFEGNGLSVVIITGPKSVHVDVRAL